jgi:hypothetical protein
MNKGVLIGGGLGMLALAFLAGVWFNTQIPEPLPTTAQGQTTTSQATAGVDDPSGTPGAAVSAAPTPADLSSINGANGADSAVPGVAPSPDAAPWSTPLEELAKNPDKEPLTREERRAIRSKVRTKMAELLAKGQNVTPEDTQRFIDEIEAVGQGVFDPRYFATLREIVGYSAQTQALSKELGEIAYSKTPEDVARREEIMSEMTGIGARISSGTAALQSYARDIAADKSAQ